MTDNPPILTRSKSTPQSDFFTLDHTSEYKLRHQSRKKSNPESSSSPVSSLRLISSLSPKPPSPQQQMANPQQPLLPQNPRPAWRNPNRSPISIQGPIHPLPHDAFRWLPRFNNDGSVSPETHLSLVTQALDSLMVKHEDVAVRLFANTFHGPVQEWFCALPPGCITSWNELETRFLAMYSKYQDPGLIVRKLTEITKEKNETIQDFNYRFMKIYTELPPQLRPPEGLAVQLYQNTLDPQLAFTLKRENHQVLSNAMNAAFDIEK